MSSSQTDAQLKVLLDAVEAAEARGQSAEASRLLAQAKALAPNHAAVLNAMAIAALRAGNAAAAKELLQRAVTRNDNVPGLWLNLASACRDTADLDGERVALDRALALQPRDYLALLSKAALVERLGDEFEASGLYQAALACAPPAGQVPQALIPRLNHAVGAVRAQAARMDTQLEAALAPVRAAHAGERQSRFDYGLAAMLGKTRIYTSQPTFLQIPGLPAVAFYEREQLPWLAELEAAASAIMGEALAILASDNPDLVPYVQFGEAQPVPEWAPLNHTLAWGAYHLWKDGAPVPANLARCPQTAALLARLPLADLPGNAPNVYFSVLRPGTRIPPHNGVTNARAIVQLPLVAPEGSYLRVGAEVRKPQAGEAYAIDDSIEHELGNDSAETQVTLVLDAWNPHLTEAERALLRTAFSESAAFTRRPSMFAGRL